MNFSHCNHFRENRTSCPCFRTAPMTAPGSARAHIALLPSSAKVRHQGKGNRPGRIGPERRRTALEQCVIFVRSGEHARWDGGVPGLGCGAVRVYSYGLSVQHRFRSRAADPVGGPVSRAVTQCDCSVGFQWTVPRFLRVLVSCGGFEFGGGAVMITSPQSTLSL